MSGSFARVADSFFRPAINSLVPYEPGKPVEEVQRELGLDRCVKLASNEGPFGPFPAAQEALTRCVRELNRYPDGGSYRLRSALAERHDVAFDQVAVGPGADALVDWLSQATLDPGDEIVLGWPSFPSYVIDALKLGAVARQVPLLGHRFDLGAIAAAIGPRTKLVYVCHPNNPTGTFNPRGELDTLLDTLPEHVLTVIDQAYFEYVDDPDYADAIEEYAKRGRRVFVLRTFSKIYGLAGLRVGYGIGPAEVVTAVNKVKRAFDLSSAAQAAACASLDSQDELERRRTLNAHGLVQLERVLRDAGFDPVPSVGNFVYADVGEDSRPLFEALLREGAIVRPLHGFGAPSAVRISVGTDDELEFLAEALARVGAGSTRR